MHFKNARNASVYAVFRAFFTQSLAKLRIRSYSNTKYWDCKIAFAGECGAKGAPFTGSKEIDSE